MTDDVRKRAWLLFWGALGASCIFLALWLIPREQAARYRQRFEGEISRLEPKDRVQLEKDLIASENAARVTMAQILGGIVVLIGLYLTYQNIQTAREGQLTDRFSKAIELLGDSDNLDVRLGGIYALERIAKDSEKDHRTVMEVLTAFVREKTKTVPKEKSSPLPGAMPERPSQPRVDIQAILTVIGRRTKRDREKEFDLMYTSLSLTDLRGADFRRVKLRKADLRGADLRGADLSEADLSEADLSEAHLAGANLSKARLSDANLSRASLTGANLCGADLNRANLREADLGEANLSGSSLIRANFRGAFLAGANLTGTDLTVASNLITKQIRSATYGRKYKKFPPDIT